MLYSFSLYFICTYSLQCDYEYMGTYEYDDELFLNTMQLSIFLNTSNRQIFYSKM